MLQDHPLISPPSSQILSGRFNWRLAVLPLLFLFALGGYIYLIASRPADVDAEHIPFLWAWGLCLLIYLIACVWIFRTRPATGRRRWLELGVIFAGALLFRALLVPLPPNLSHDSWRYLWDAKITLQGYSPYIYPPNSPQFAGLHNNILFHNSRYRDVPTLYPPAAQLFYLISQILVPDSLSFLKGIFVAFDLGTCGVLAYLLQRNGQDPRRAILYAWCPLPIIEFALQGHLDTMPILVMLLTFITNQRSGRWGRVLTGVLIGIATLMKLYPIVLLIAVVRRKDWELVISCMAVIGLGYLPYIILGHGRIFGFFSTYIGEQGTNAGIIQLGLQAMCNALRLDRGPLLIIERGGDLLVMGGAVLIVFWLRWRRNLSVEAASLILIGMVLSVSSHFFPWYAAVLLPLVALLWQPLRIGGKLNPGIVAPVAIWYQICSMPLGYLYASKSDWTVYYLFTYDIMLALLIIAGVLIWKSWDKNAVKSNS